MVSWADGAGLKENLETLDNVLRFVTEVVEGKIPLFSLDEEKLVETLRKKEFLEKQDGYRYLLDTPVISFTTNRVLQLTQQRDDAASKLTQARKEAAQNAREQIRKRLEALSDKRERFQKVMERLENTQESLKVSAGSLVEEVKTKMESVKEAITIREGELLTQVERIEKTKKTQLSEQGEDLQMVVKSISGCIAEVDSAMAKKDPYDFLEAAANVEPNVDRHLSLAADQQAKTTASFELKLQVFPQLSAINQISLFPQSDTQDGKQPPLALPEALASHPNISSEEPDKAQAPTATVDAMPEQVAVHEGAVRPQAPGSGPRERGGPSQIHLISPGAEGKERASIITVSEKRTDTPERDNRKKSSNAGGEAGWLESHITNGIGGGLLKLSNLRISNQDLSVLQTTLSTLTTLTTVDLTDSCIGDEGASLVASAFAGNSTVTALGLSGNKIGDQGVRAIAGMLGRNKSLLSLFLRNNNVGSDGARALAEALANENRTLTKLNLKNNKIGEKGSRELVPMLQNNHTLQELNLWSNELGSGGATALAGALKEGGGIADLELGCNSIGNSGLTSIAQALRGNRRLERLNVRWNDVDEDGVKALCSGLEGNVTIKELHIFGNKLSPEANELMAELQSKVPTLKVLK